MEIGIELFTLLDTIINGINETGQIDEEMYNTYLGMVLDCAPVELRRFFTDLSNIGTKSRGGFLARLRRHN
jgi:hypothetical protein